MSAYVGYLFEVERHAREGAAGLRVEGRICYTLPQPPGRSILEVQEAALARWDRGSYRIGVRLGQEQRFEHIAYARDGGGEIVLRYDPEVTEELGRLFQPPAGEQWVGLIPESDARRAYQFVEPNVICFFLQFVLTPARPEQQLLPMVARHRGRFAESFMPGLWALPGLK